MCLLGEVTSHVAIIMGSDSDLPVMKDAAEILKVFDVPFEVGLFPRFKKYTEVLFSFTKSLTYHVVYQKIADNNCFGASNT